MLTQEFLKENFRYDPNTGDFYWIKHSVTKKRNLKDPINYRDYGGYIVVTFRHGGVQKTYKVHRLIWIYVHGKLTNQIDHINGIRDDNRLCNLREVTAQQNSMNKAKMPSIHNLTGVYHTANKKRWMAQIAFQNKRRHLGCFDTPEEASSAYQKAKAELFKEFART
jgi:hypothetical protein